MRWPGHGIVYHGAPGTCVPESAHQASPASESISNPVPHVVPRPPRWVYDLMCGGVLAPRLAGRIEIVVKGGVALLSVSIADARGLEAAALRERVAAAYVSLGAALGQIALHPIRFWNFVPSIGDRMGSGLDRYMVFNAGRYDGFERCYGEPRSFSQSLATASCIGTLGPDLVIHCLAADRPGTSIENPRQVPAWRYSSRYGPRPPCFSRATLAGVDHRTLILIGGTASILGEESRHEHDPECQLDETLGNLESLIAAAPGGMVHTPPLERIVDLRAYIVRPDDAVLVRSTLAARCPRAARLELTIARICRPELLVEIEAVADVQTG